MSKNGKQRQREGKSPDLHVGGLRDLPDGWRWTTIHDSTEEVYRYPNFYGMPHLERFVGSDVSSKFPRTVCNAGDLIMSVRGSVGKVGVIGADLVGAQVSPNCIRIATSNALDSRFLLRYLQSSSARQLVQGQTNATTIQTIKAGTFVSTPVPVAPLAEQRRIVAKIEELFSDLDAGVAALERAKANLKRYRAAVLKAAVEGKLTAAWRAENSGTEAASDLLQRILHDRRQKWEQQQLAAYQAKGKEPPKNWRDKCKPPAAPDTTNLPKLPNGWCWATPEQLGAPEDYSLAIGPFGSNLKVSDYRDQGVPLVFVRNIRSGQFGGNNARFVSHDKASELAAHSVDSGDVLITKMGDPPGDAILYPEGQPHAIITADCIKFRPSPLLVHPHFFVWAINSKIVHRQIMKITRGVAQKKVSLGRFSTIAFPLAPLEEQEQFVREIEERCSIADATESQLDVDAR